MICASRGRAAALLVALVLVACGCASVIRVDTSSSGTQGNRGATSPPAVSADGRYVAFTSAATNLVPNDNDNFPDVFVKDTSTGAIQIASVNLNGVPTGGFAPSITADGRYVAFTSDQPIFLFFGGQNLVFVRDLYTGTTDIASADSTDTIMYGSSTASISADGRYVAFQTSTALGAGDQNGNLDIALRDRTNRTTTLVSATSSGSAGNNGSTSPVLSANGRYVAFTSIAGDLVTGDTNATTDVFVRDLTTATTTRANVSSAGAQGNALAGEQAISPDGRYVTFISAATNLVSGDTNGGYDAFVRDRQTSTTTRVSLSSGGAQTNATPFHPSISADGRYVAFDSMATNLVAGDTNALGDVFVRDRQTATTTRVSTTSSFGDAVGNSFEPVLSADGRNVAFLTDAVNLVTPDTNSATDVILRANPVPTITSLSPTSVARGTTRTITVNGTNLLPGVGALFGEGVTVTTINRVSESQVTFTISVASNAVTGARQVIVYNVGTGPGQLTGAAASTAITVT